MSIKSLNPKEIVSEVPATTPGPRPGDFPLRSPQSRAAVRLMLASRKPRFTEYDQDAITIYREVAFCRFGYQASPSSWDLQSNPVYKHGQALSFKLHPIMPAHLNEHSKRSTPQSREFELAFGREPESGDVLRYEHVAAMYDPRLIEAKCQIFTDAWERRLPDWPCPQKFDSGCLFVRTLNRVAGEARDEETWVQDEAVQPKAIWREFERYIKWLALGKPNGLRIGPLNLCLDDIPTIPALTFRGVGPRELWSGRIENQHCCRSSTPEELEKPDPEPRDGLLKKLQDIGLRIRSD